MSETIPRSAPVTVPVAPPPQAGSYMEWLNVWNPGQTYNVGEVVKYEGDVYICQVAVIASKTPPVEDAEHWVATNAGGVPFPYLYDAKGNFVIGEHPAKVTGIDNTGLGQQSLTNLESGEKNTVIGQAAGDTLTKANRNTLLGYATLDNTTIGDDNVVLGYGGLNGTAEANRNTIIGTSAGELTKHEVNNNILIGYQTMRELKTNGNTIIGYKAAPATDNGNKLVLGVENGTLIEGSLAPGEHYAEVKGQFFVKRGGAELKQLVPPWHESTVATTIGTGGAPKKVAGELGKKKENAEGAAIEYTAPFTMSWASSSEGGYVIRLYRDGELVRELNILVGAGATTPLAGTAYVSWVQEEAGEHAWEVTIQVYGTEAQMSVFRGVFSIS